MGVLRQAECAHGAALEGVLLDWASSGDVLAPAIGIALEDAKAQGLLDGIHLNWVWADE
jgi:hypothetical protein